MNITEKTITLRTEYNVDGTERLVKEVKRLEYKLEGDEDRRFRLSDLAVLLEGETEGYLVEDISVYHYMLVVCLSKVISGEESLEESIPMPAPEPKEEPKLPEFPGAPKLGAVKDSSGKVLNTETAVDLTPEEEPVVEEVVADVEEEPVVDKALDADHAEEQFDDLLVVLTDEEEDAVVVAATEQEEVTEEALPSEEVNESEIDIDSLFGL